MQPFDTPPTSAPSAFEPAPELKSPWRPNRLTSGIVAGGAAFAMVLAGLGIASAQTDGSTTTPPPAASAEGRHPHRHHALRIALDTAATTLGMSEGDLRAQLRDGKSLAEIAGDKTDALISALVAAANGRIDAAVADGKLTQAEADARKANLTERITALVNRTGPAGGHHHADGPDGTDGDTAPQPEPASIVTA